MSDLGAFPGSKYFFSEIERNLFEFEEILKTNGLQIGNGTDLERLSLKITEIVEKNKGNIQQDNKRDIRIDLSEVMGLNEFIRKIIINRDDENFKQLIPHLRMMNQCSILQNVQREIGDITDQGANKLFELYIALLCMRFTKNIQLDSPDNSQGDNPDILFDLKGEKWAIACKVMHTSLPKTLYDRFKDGIRQINNSSAEKGIVLINLKNAVDFEEIWPTDINVDGVASENTYRLFPSLEIPTKMLEKYGEKYRSALINEIGLSQIQGDLSGNIKTPKGFLLFIQAGTSILYQSCPTSTILRTFNNVGFDSIDEKYSDLYRSLNFAMHEKNNENN